MPSVSSTTGGTAAAVVSAVPVRLSTVSPPGGTVVFSTVPTTPSAVSVAVPATAVASAGAAVVAVSAACVAVSAGAANVSTSDGSSTGRMWY